MELSSLVATIITAAIPPKLRLWKWRPYSYEKSIKPLNLKELSNFLLGSPRHTDMLAMTRDCLISGLDLSGCCSAVLDVQCYEINKFSTETIETLHRSHYDSKQRTWLFNSHTGHTYSASQSLRKVKGLMNSSRTWPSNWSQGSLLHSHTASSKPTNLPGDSPSQKITWCQLHTSTISEAQCIETQIHHWIAASQSSSRNLEAMGSRAAAASRIPLDDATNGVYRSPLWSSLIT